MLEGPADFEGTYADAQYTLVAVTNSWRSLQDFDRLPGWREAFERVGLGMPAKNFFGGRVNTRSSYEMKLVGHTAKAVSHARASSRRRK
jgi:hypothetical protein